MVAFLNGISVGEILGMLLVPVIGCLLICWLFIEIIRYLRRH